MVLTTSRSRLATVGAGPAGLTAAFAAARLGADVTVFRGRRRLRPRRRWDRAAPERIARSPAPAMTPDYGQGANAAMVDGLVLATHLARSAMDAEAIASGARQYEAIRRPFVDRTQSDAWRTSRMARVRSPAGRWARNTLVRLVSRLSAVRARQLRRIAGDNPHEVGYL